MLYDVYVRLFSMRAHLMSVIFNYIKVDIPHKFDNSLHVASAPAESGTLYFLSIRLYSDIII